MSRGANNELYFLRNVLVQLPVISYQPRDGHQFALYEVAISIGLVFLICVAVVHITFQTLAVSTKMAAVLDTWEENTSEHIVPSQLLSFS